MITVILNCYRRPQNLELQLDAIRKQTVPPKDIWIWKNYHEDNKDFYYNNLGCKVFNCNYNWKYCGRFAAACLVDTEFTAIFDDDTIPGPKWFENCLTTYDDVEDNAILGGVGVTLQTQESYQPFVRTGWVAANNHIEPVDLVGHTWFFKSSNIQYMWREKPFWDNGEDMHFSAMSQIHGNICTYAPPHPRNDMDKWSSLYGQQLGVDNVASSAVRKHTQFYKERNACVQRLVSLGWKLQNFGGRELCSL